MESEWSHDSSGSDAGAAAQPFVALGPLKTSIEEMPNRHTSLVGERMEYRARTINANARRIRLPEKNAGSPFKFEC